MSEAASVPPDLLAHARFVQRLARSLIADAHGAEDVAQETWRRSLEHPPARPGDLRGWLARVVRNLAFQRRRNDVRRAEREQRAARAEAVPAEDGLERTETLERVVAAVRALDEPYRATILARFYEDLPPRAIARRDGIPLETVNTRLKRGLARLRSELARERREWRGELGLLAGESACLPDSVSSTTTLVAFMKAKTVIASALLLLVGWGLWEAVVSEDRASEDRPAATLAQGPMEVTAAPEATPGAVARGREPRLAASEVAAALSGRVIDEQGSPVPGARVQVLGSEDPFGGEYHPSGTAGRNLLYGRIFACDDDGLWRAELPRPMRVLVALETTETLEPAPGSSGERWVDAPASEVDFVVRRIPAATLEVRVFEGAEHRPLEDFSVLLYGSATVRPDGGIEYSGGYHGAASEGGVARDVLGIREPGGRRVHVVLTEPDLGGLWAKLGLEPSHRPEQEVWLLPGEVEHVVFVLPERGVVRGVVVDEQGSPIRDALVFFGEEARARGDEPFKPVRTERIADGTRTGADGGFELRGDGERVTALHPDFCGATVRAERAGRIVLGALGTIRGRLLDEGGRPVAGAVVLRGHPSDPPDESASATTDATGSFLFERVDAGAHALWRDTGGEEGELLLCVRVAPGAEVEVELRLGSQRALELEIPALAPDEPALDGVIVGLDETSGLCWLERGIARGLALPGRYWLASRQGLCAPLVVGEHDPRARVELGSATLVVRSRRRANVQVVPPDADAFTRLMAARAWVKAEGESEARFRLQPGRYLLVGDAGVVLRDLELPPEGLTLDLE